jgi:phage tail protein X
MVRQWWLLTRRNVDVLFRNRLTLAVLLGSPVLVTAMMATLFKRGAFDPGGAADVGPAQIVFWIAFDGFFFGLTYGLLQIVGEIAVFRRERLAGLSVGAYVASKVTALLPVLAAVSAVLLAVLLRVLGRLPAVGWHVYALLFVTMVIEATSALALGLAILSTIATTASNHRLPDSAATLYRGLATHDINLIQAASSALTHGYTTAFLVAAAFFVAGLVITVLAINARRAQSDRMNDTPGGVPRRRQPPSALDQKGSRDDQLHR